MNTITLPAPATLRTRGDVAAYITLLDDHGILYHLDDTPSTCCWSEPVDVAALDALHDALWAVCDPWTLGDACPCIADLEPTDD